MTPALFRAVLPVADLARADAFWSRLLELDPDRAVPGRHYLHTAGAIVVLVDPIAHDRAHGRPARPFQPQADWLTFRVPDLDATWRRACQLGWTPGEPEPGIRVRVWGDRSPRRGHHRVEPPRPAHRLVHADAGGDRRARSRARGVPREFRPNPELVYFAVPDLDACHERALRLGMRALPGEPVGIHTWPWGERSSYGLDPSGNPIALVDDRTLYTGDPR